MSDTTSYESVSEDTTDATLDELLDGPEGDNHQELVETEPATPAEYSEDYGETDSPDEAPGEHNQPGGRFVADSSKVRLKDGRVVTVGDLKAGSLRQADYTRKTQELAAQRKSVEERNRRVEQLEGQLTHERNFVYQVLQNSIPPAPDKSLLDEDPIAFMEQKHLHDQWREYLNALKQQYATAQARAAEQQQARLQEAYDLETQKLLEVRPKLRDRKVNRAWRDDVMQFAPEAYGLTPQELTQVGDHRWLMILTDAVQWQKFQANKGRSLSKAAGKPPVQPGRRQSPKAQQARVRKTDLQQLQATGGKDEKSLDRLLDTFI